MRLKVSCDQLGEVVAICDHLGLLGRAQLEHEVAGEAIRVALDLLITLPAYAALRPYVVGLECIEPKEADAVQSKQDQGPAG